ncbi:hypothetical protein LTR08_002759 [Meristemomyces frigidus]|nr:hypothetical protein LTR08_002759 [Meristemomyces frigidus]
MSGAEAVLVIGLVSSTLTVFEAAYQVYTAVHDVKGLAKTFQATGNQIPLVLHTLQLVEQSIKANNIATERYKKAAVMKVRSGEVKKSMELVMEGLNLPAQHQIFQDADTMEDIKAAIEELAKAGDEEENTRSIHHGSDNINNYTGSGNQENHTNSGGGSFYSAASMSFSKKTE